MLWLQVRRQDGEQRHPGAGDVAVGRGGGRDAHPQHGEERHGVHAPAGPQASSGPGVGTLTLLTLLTSPLSVSKGKDWKKKKPGREISVCQEFTRLV